MKIIGLGDYRVIMERKWFALRNFHCHYFEDSWILNEYIQNWGESIDDHYQQVKNCCSFGIRTFAALSRIPGLRVLLRKLAYNRMKSMVSKKDGTLYWYKSKNQPRISAFYGSYEDYEKIGDWDTIATLRQIPESIRLYHGYDESKQTLGIEDLRDAANFRGGQVLSSVWSGDMFEKLKWRCSFNHDFSASPYLVLKTGHWCPECLAPPWRYNEEAKRNPFLAQVWFTNHSRDEMNQYSETDAVL